jgi:hypothetical protein
MPSLAAVAAGVDLDKTRRTDTARVGGDADAGVGDADESILGGSQLGVTPPVVGVLRALSIGLPINRSSFWRSVYLNVALANHLKIEAALLGDGTKALAGCCENGDGEVFDLVAIFAASGRNRESWSHNRRPTGSFHDVSTHLRTSSGGTTLSSWALSTTVFNARRSWLRALRKNARRLAYFHEAATAFWSSMSLQSAGHFTTPWLKIGVARDDEVR